MQTLTSARIQKNIIVKGHAKIQWGALRAAARLARMLMKKVLAKDFASPLSPEVLRLIFPLTIKEKKNIFF